MMKRLYNYLGVLIGGLFCIVVLHTSLLADSVRKVNKSFNLKANTNIALQNKFGKIHIDTWEKQVFEIEVRITAKGNSESRNQDLLDRIEVEFDDNISSGNLEIATEVEKIKNNNNSFSVDYWVKMPDDKSLELHNSFGDVYLPDYRGDLDITVKYGQVRAGNLTGALELYVAFGSSKSPSALGNLNNAEILLKYSKLECGNVKNLELESQFSDFIAQDIDRAEIACKYGKVLLGQVNTIEGEMAFSDLKIVKLNKIFDLEVKYGDGLDIEELSSDFELVNVETSFSQFKLSLGRQMSSYIEANLQFGDLKTSGDEFHFNVIKKDHTSSYYEGYFGKAGSDAKILITSKYGDVKLSED